MLASSTPANEGRSLEKWQAQLLPFMTRTVIALAAFFFLASLTQLAYLHWDIRQQPPAPAGSLGALPEAAPGVSMQDRLATAQFQASVLLEREALSRRYRQVTVLLMGRLWTTYLGFVTGMILALVGAAFVVGKLTERASELKLEGSFSVVSTSPGLILAVLGTLLMMTAIVTHHPIATNDAPLYVGRGAAAPVAGTAPPLGNPYERAK